MIGGPVSALADPADADSDALQRLVSVRERGFRETPGVTKDGRSVVVARSVAPYHDWRGEMSDIFAIAYDVTELVRARRALGDTETRYGQILEAIRAGVITVDAEERITYVNQAMASMLGADPRKLLGRSMYDFVSAGSRDSARRIIARHRQGFGATDLGAMRAIDGREFPVEVSASPLSDGSGAYLGAKGSENLRDQRSAGPAPVRARGN